MTIRSCTFVLVVVAALAVACDGKNPQPVGPSASPSGEGAASSSAQARVGTMSAAEHAVSLFDACDPETFIAVGVPCTRNGGVRFDKFVEQLTQHHSIGSWHFAPSQVNMQVGQMLTANNRGGEAHTFTEVANFGGGRIAFINNLVGLTTPAPECAQSVDIPPGGSFSETTDEAGVEKYQCCIHPWMRAEVRITEK